MTRRRPPEGRDPHPLESVPPYPASKVPDPKSNNGRRDLLTHRLLAGALAACALVSMFTTVGLAIANEPVPAALLVIAAASVGGLAGANTGIMSNHGAGHK